jgi:hypothetical protein
MTRETWRQKIEGSRLNADDYRNEMCEEEWNDNARAVLLAAEAVCLELRVLGLVLEAKDV